MTWVPYNTIICYPQSTEELSEVISIAFNNEIPIRTRGAGHALNGSTFPNEGELWVETQKLSKFIIHDSTQITVGSGINLYLINTALSDFGLTLPVINDGFPGPSVGGFISAGGFGIGSSEFGGFWENVDEITVVNGVGKIICVNKSHHDFPWYFGAMGQLGVIAEIKLKVRSSEGRSMILTREYSLNDEDITRTEVLLANALDQAVRNNAQLACDLEAMHYFQTREKTDKRIVDRNPQYWFSFFIEERDVPFVKRQLAALQAHYSEYFIFEPIFEYFIKFRSFNPPLLFSTQNSFYAVGSWWTVLSLNNDVQFALKKYELNISSITQDWGYRRYIQSELPRGPEFYRSYFGTELYSNFNNMKMKYDPNSIINRGTVFR